MTMSLERAFDTAKVGLIRIENILDVLGSAAAGRSEVRHDRFTLICRDHPARLAYRLRSHLRLDRDALINLRPNGRYHIEALSAVRVRVCYGISASGDRLRLLRFEMRE